MFPKRFLLGLVFASFAVPAHAAWSSNPALNLAVGDAASDQAVPKLVATPDGGCYISWYDGIGNGYDVRVQKLDVYGNEVFPHNGVLVANTSFSSVTDHGLDVDVSGNALLAFCDDRFGNTQITAQKVSPTGTLLWGTNGIQLTSTTDFVASPRITGTGEGGVVIAWTQNNLAKVAKLASNGSPMWGTPITLTPPTGSYSPSDAHGFGTDVLISIVHQTGGFGSPRHLLVQKFDGAGGTPWGSSTPRVVLDNGSLQNGNFPAFLPDGTGGGVFSWYDVSTPTLQCSAQHINSDGTEAFAHNGVTVSTNTMRIRVDPWAAHDPVSHNTYVFWEEENSLQSQFGLYGQKLDATGGRLWGSSGIAFVALSNVAVLWTRTVLSGNGAYVFWSGEPSFNQDRVYGMHVDGNGNVDVPQFDVASTPSGKQRFNVASSTAGYAILDWADARTDGGDIYAQDIPLGAPTAVPEIGRAATTLALQARPNPSAGAVFVQYAVPLSAATNLDVLDVAGRLVRHLQTGTATSGSATWDGRDDSGRDVSAGVYFVRLKAGAAMDSRRVTLIR